MRGERGEKRDEEGEGGGERGEGRGERREGRRERGEEREDVYNPTWVEKGYDKFVRVIGINDCVCAITNRSSRLQHL